MKEETNSKINAGVTGKPQMGPKKKNAWEKVLWGLDPATNHGVPTEDLEEGMDQWGGKRKAWTLQKNIRKQ